MKQKILIITHSNDNDCVKNVSAALSAEGASVIRFDTDLYPTQVGLTTRYTNGNLRSFLDTAEGPVDLSEVNACWYRRLWIGKGIPKNMDPQLRAPSLEESRRSFSGVLNSLDAFCFDPYFHVKKASVKQLQLKVADQLGLNIPKTCITNKAEDVRAFYRQCTGEVITKMQSSFAVFREGVENVVFTNTIDEEMLDDLDGLEYCPMTFQEMIPKELELRVTIVGDQVFAAAIDSQQMEATKTDWRKDGVGLADYWVKHDLPADIKTKLLGIMDYFQLNYGAIDLILSPDGQYHFLEINPAGEYMWLEDTPGFEISEQIAKVLLGKCFRRNEVSR